MSAGYSPATVAEAFGEAFIAAAQTAINDPTVWINFGLPGEPYPDESVSVGKISSQQSFGPMGNRSRDEILQLECSIEILKVGGHPVEQLVRARAYQLLGLIERYCRVTDTNLGGSAGAVRECWLISHTLETAAMTDESESRLASVLAVFQAKARITG